MKKLLFYCLLIFTANSCQLHVKGSKEESLTGTWRLYDVEPVKGESGGASFTEMASLKQVVQEGQVLSFFGDGKFTELKGAGHYKAGSFQYVQQAGSLTFAGENGSTAEATIETGKNEKQVLSIRNKQQQATFKYIRETDAGADPGESPFYTANNLWRVKPAQAENEDQLRNRLTNYIKHVALILKSSKESKHNVVSFEYSLGPIKIYNGGIGIHPYELIPQSWKDTFFTEEEAFTAYRMYESFLRKNHYRGAATGDWVEDDYTILLSIYAGLTGGKRDDR